MGAQSEGSAMHAIRQYEFGPAEELRYEEVEDPRPAPGQVRIAVRAAGVHLIDTAIRAGSAGPFPRPDLPMTPGREVAGIVDAVGEGVDPRWLGLRAVAHLGTASGGYAELAVREVDAVYEIPEGLSFETAVTMIGTGRTTMGVLSVADLRPEDVVLVTAAAGGIGNLAVQYAKAVGATVVGVAGGAAKAARVRELGADVAVDYGEPGWDDHVRDALKALGDREVTVLLDGVGGDLGRTAMKLIGVGGRLILFGASGGAITPVSTEDLYSQGLTVSMAVGPRLFALPGGIRALERAALDEAASGRLAPLTRTFALAEAAAAHAALESRGTEGKVVLVP